MKKMKKNKILLFVLSMMIITGNGLTTFGSAGSETNQEETNILGIDVGQHVVGESEINGNETDQNEPNTLGIESEISGTAGNRIYKISSAEELLDLSIKVNEGEIGQKTTIELENDITINIPISEGSNWVIGNWVPIGCKEHEFKGTFDGHNHKILGIFCEEKRKDNIGLFGVVGKEGIVKNVTIENSKFGGNENVGGICGTNKGTIINCNSKCIINGHAGIGGNVGSNEGTVEGVKNLAGSSVTGHHFIGGNVGLNKGTVKGSENGGNITGEGEDNQQIGGNVGWNRGTVEGVKNLAGSSVTGHHFIGGNVGCNEEGGTVKGSENGGNITGENIEGNELKNHQIGGNVGRNEGTVEGVKNLAGSSVKGNWAVGGNVGLNKEGGTVTGCENKGYMIGNIIGNIAGDIARNVIRRNITAGNMVESMVHNIIAGTTRIGYESNCYIGRNVGWNQGTVRWNQGTVE